MTVSGGPDVGSPCIFPFIFNGVTYNQCAEDQDGKWCSTQVLFVFGIWIISYMKLLLHRSSAMVSMSAALENGASAVLTVPMEVEVRFIFFHKRLHTV